MEVFAHEARSAALNNPRDELAFRDLEDSIYGMRDMQCEKLRYAYQKLEKTVSEIYNGSITGEALKHFVRADLLKRFPPALDIELRYFQLVRRSATDIEFIDRTYSIFIVPRPRTEETFDL
jgi:hypothetical protein